MMDDHRIPLEELRQRYQTDYTKGLTSAKAQQLNEQFGKKSWFESKSCNNVVGWYNTKREDKIFFIVLNYLVLL